MKKLFIPFAFLLILAACSKKDANVSPTTNGIAPTGKIAPDGFAYQTTKQITVDVTLATNTNQPLPHIPVAVYALSNNDTALRVAIAVTDASGNIHYTATVPANIDTFVVRPNCIGVLNNAKVVLVNNSLTCKLGGPTGYVGNLAGTYHAQYFAKHAKYASFDINGTSTNTTFSYLGTWNSSGVPNYLLPNNDTISVNLTNNLVYTLPEGVNLTTSSHSSLLSSNATSDIILTKTSDVWITFLYENCGFNSSLGFYVYNTNNPPASLKDIKNITFIYPDCKFAGGGGGLIAGNKVHLGTFGPDTTVGLVLYANAWTGSGVNTTAAAYFTDAYLNPEPTAALQKHAVLMQYTDPTTNKTVYPICFEDENRYNGGSDNDFNDVCVYATTNPVTAIDASNIKHMATSTDTDGDGVCDPLDAYPNDPTRAYNNYYPNVGVYGTYAYEDNWPNQGDYDMNDLVVSYNYNLITNAQNQVVEIKAKFTPTAAGANFQNGFGVQFPFASSAVTSVTGQKLGNFYTSQNANGTEAKQTNAVIIPFDGTRQLISNTDGNPMVNTLLSEPKVTGDTSFIDMQLATPQSNLNPATFNPFCISNMRRGYEIHLPNFAPTNLANLSLLGTGQDASNPSQGIYYVTKNNYPFGLNIPQAFSYPVEKVPIYNAYLYFLSWSGSGGASYTDWYFNTAAGYQNTSNIYNK